MCNVKAHSKVSTMSAIINRGTGAGGANTNLNGIAFEDKTDNSSYLLKNGFIQKPIPGSSGKYAYYLEKILDGDRSIIFTKQNGLKNYMKHFHNKELFREPDEAYLFRNGTLYVLYILEKKNQNGAGSVDVKLCAAQWFKDEYKECLGNNFTVEYGFCLSNFLKKEYESDTPKWKTMRTLHNRASIRVLFGDDADYFTKLNEWLSL